MNRIFFNLRPGGMRRGGVRLIQAAALALLVSLIIIVSLARNFKMHDFTVTEQTTNDSD